MWLRVIACSEIMAERFYCRIVHQLRTGQNLRQDSTKVRLIETESANSPLLFGKQQRLQTSAEFKLCYNGGVRAGDDHLLVFAVVNDLPHSRIGVSVSKKHGNAVARNRKKRLLRESFRIQQFEIPAGLDLVLVPRQRSDSGLAEYSRSLKRITRKLARRLNQGSEPEPNP